MMQALKQSTAATVLVGPVLDADGAAYTGAVIDDFNLTKNGTTAALASPATATHSHNGHYLIAFATGNTDTLGRLSVSMNKATYGMTVFRWQVLSAAQFDALVTNGSITPNAIADATLSSSLSGPSTGGNWQISSFGRQLIVSHNSDREVAVTGAHHIAADVHEFQPGVITDEDFATDAISDDTVSSDAVTKIVTGVWSALLSGMSVVGSVGWIMSAIASMMEQISGVWRWTETALEQAPSGAMSIQILPATGLVAGRGETTSLVAYVGETISQTVAVYQADGTTPFDLSGKTLVIIFENTKTGEDVATIPNGSIAVSGGSNNTITFSYPSAATEAQRELAWTLRDAAAPSTVYLRGTLEVRYAPTVGS